jgi:hypothetical protein
VPGITNQVDQGHKIELGNLAVCPVSLNRAKHSPLSEDFSMTFRFIENLALDTAVYRAAIATGREMHKFWSAAPAKSIISDNSPDYMANGGGFFTGSSQIRSFKDYGPWKMTFIVASNHDEVIVAIQGTKYDIHKEMNGETNRNKGVPSPIETGLSGVMVHPGWSQGTDSIIGAVKSELQRQQAQGKTILICGHSMGGAVAGYLTYRLMKETPQFFHPNRDHRLITFGAPRYAAKELVFGLFNFKTSFEDLAKARGLTPISVEMKGDNIVHSWRDKVPHVEVNRLGQPLNLATSSSDKHDSANYFKAIEQLHTAPPARLRLIRLDCHETSEFGEDEIFLQVSDGTRYPRGGGVWDIDDNESRQIDPSGRGILFMDDRLDVYVWEDDDTSRNDKIGHIQISETLRGRGLQKVSMTGDDSRYTLYYEVV